MVDLLDAVEEDNEGEVIRLLDAHPELLDTVPLPVNTNPQLLLGAALLVVVPGLGPAVFDHFCREKVPLILASSLGRLRIVTMLLQRGADPRATGRFGTTALQWAARKGHEEVAVCLLSNGAAPNTTDIRDRTPLIEAASGGYLGIVHVLLQHLGGHEVGHGDDEGRTALHYAVGRGHEEVVTALLSHGAQANTRDGEGMVPLMLACFSGHLGLVQMLLQHVGGQGLEEGDDRNRTALYYAAEGGHEDVVGFLLGRGARRNSRDDVGATPLMMASIGGHVGAVQVLVQHCTGAQGLEERDGMGATALHYAAVEGRKDVVRVLLGSGAEAHSKEDRGTTPMMLAAIKGHVAVVRLIVKHAGKRGLEEKGPQGMTALHMAALKAHEEVVRCLLLAGADPTCTDEGGNTPRAHAQWFAEEEEGYAGCIAVLDWWEGELERHAVLSRATCLHQVYMIQRDKPTSRLPTYLEARAAAGHAVPSVEVVLPQSQEEKEEEGQAGASRKRKAASEPDDAGEAEGEEGELNAMMGYVVRELNEALVTELLEGFHS